MGRALARASRRTRWRRACSTTRPFPSRSPQRKGDPLTITRDEHPRPGTTAESLARLKPMMAQVRPDATVTAGNSSGQNDAAAVAIVTTPAKAEALGLRPLARLVTWSLAGVEPRLMGIGPVPAAQKALKRAGLSWSDIDLIELNEAFAAQVLGCFRGWGLSEADLERVNVNGSGISLGHPIGATGGPHPGQLAARDGPPRGAIRHGDHVHGWRSGCGGHLRAGGVR